MQVVEGKRVAALIGDGFEEIDLTEPRRALEEAGAIVTIVGIDERARQRIRGKRGLDDGQSVRAEELIGDCTAEDFDAALIPGGTSPDRIRTDREGHRFVREFDAAKKPMFSIGHGAQVLISSQLVRSRQVTGAHSIADAGLGATSNGCKIGALLPGKQLPSSMARTRREQDGIGKSPEKGALGSQFSAGH